ncbi:hypothetical protein ACFOY2_05065 [Nonomuraea purpurea]|uniref:Uncharacterized protein n=1 Tax=Nonomuraea purpurea TaxID=1849276 RepID=A0ABV8G050_9ACTN
MISKRHAQGIQHLLGMLAPGHPGTYQLVKSRAQEVVSELADLSAGVLGSGLNGVQFLAEWDSRPEVTVWLTAHETFGGSLVFDGAHLDEDAARDQAEEKARDAYAVGTAFAWGPVHPDDPHGPQALFADPPEEEERPTGYQVHLMATRLV